MSEFTFQPQSVEQLRAFLEHMDLVFVSVGEGKCASIFDLQYTMTAMMVMPKRHLQFVNDESGIPRQDTSVPESIDLTFMVPRSKDEIGIRMTVGSKLGYIEHDFRKDEAERSEVTCILEDYIGDSVV